MALKKYKLLLRERSTRSVIVSAPSEEAVEAAIANGSLDDSAFSVIEFYDGGQELGEELDADAQERYELDAEGELVLPNE